MALLKSTIFGTILLSAGILASVVSVGEGTDFPVLYVMGRAMLNGVNVYLPEYSLAFPQEFGVLPPGMYYPPVTAVAVSGAQLSARPSTNTLPSQKVRPVMKAIFATSTMPRPQAE